MNVHRRHRRPGFTLIEMMVVVLIVVIVATATIKVAIFDQGGRQVSEAARMLQASIVGARDAAFRANAPRGIRLLPDPNFNGQNGTALAANRMISIAAAPDYNAGMASVRSASSLGAVNKNGMFASFLVVNEAVATKVSTGNANVAIPNEPTAWCWNIRQGDKIRFGDSGRYYTIAGPITVGAYDPNSTPAYAPVNVERYINNGKQGQWYLGVNGFGTYDPNPLDNAVFPGANPSPTNQHFNEFLRLVNGQDDDGDGWVDESFDGIDNDGDGIVDPAFNGVDDDGNGVIDDESELLWSKNSSGAQGYYGGEFEAEQFVGNEFNSLNISGLSDKPYTILRRPVVAEGAREVMLPDGVVIDLTTWNAPAAVNAQGNAQGTLPERSRLPVDPYSHFVDIMVSPQGQVVPAGAGASASAGSGGMTSFPTANMPFYHFWIAERGDIYDPLFGSKQLTANGNALIGAYVPFANTGNGVVNLLPMPQGATGYTPSGLQATNNGPYLKGDYRLVTVFVRTGQVLSYDLGISDFNASNINTPYLHAQLGTREAK